jgi:uncharacterized membrane protein YcaP (DUF421 family)
VAGAQLWIICISACLEWLLQQIELYIMLICSTPLIGVFIMLRIVLKRQAGTLGMTDLPLITLLVDASQNAMAGEYKSLPDGVVLVATIIFWNYLFDWLTAKSAWFERLIEPPPLPLG